MKQVELCYVKFCKSRVAEVRHHHNDEYYYNFNPFTDQQDEPLKN
jgi:hypothetical protein